MHTHIYSSKGRKVGDTKSNTKITLFNSYDTEV